MLRTRLSGLALLLLAASQPAVAAEPASPEAVQNELLTMSKSLKDSVARVLETAEDIESPGNAFTQLFLEGPAEDALDRLQDNTEDLLEAAQDLDGSSIKNSFGMEKSREDRERRFLDQFRITQTAAQCAYANLVRFSNLAPAREIWNRNVAPVFNQIENVSPKMVAFKNYGQSLASTKLGENPSASTTDRL
jgi:hypothetical protein